MKNHDILSIFYLFCLQSTVEARSPQTFRALCKRIDLYKIMNTERREAEAKRLSANKEFGYYFFAFSASSISQRRLMRKVAL